ncbi:MAG: AAA family ATPase [Flavobacteriales bacterium]
MRLELEGIFSYKEKQVVDFATLTAGGLFGIFGAVGSGKSSILEAMMLALYAEPERLSMRGERTSLMHLQSSLLRVCLDFEAGNPSETYRAVFELQRKKKNPEELESPERFFYKKENDQWVPQDIGAIEEVLGMRLNDFRRTVIIPQGKFQEFVQLNQRDRTEMLRDLFGLHRFDLSDKVKSLLMGALSEKGKLESAVATLGELSQEKIAEKKESLKACESTIQSKSKEVAELQERLKAMELTKRLADEFLEKKKSLEHFLLQKESFDARKQRLERYFKVKLEVSPILMQQQELERACDKLRNELDALNAALTKYQQAMPSLQEQVATAKKEVEMLPERERRIALLERIAERNTAAAKAIKLEKESTEKRTEFQSLEEKYVSQEASIKEKELIVENTKSLWGGRFKEVLKMDINWEELQRSRLLLETSRKQLLTLTDKIASEERQKAEFDTILISNKAKDFTALLESLTEKMNTTQKELQVMREKEGLETFRHLVVDGQPCPLCGSLHHEQHEFNQSDEISNKEKELHDFREYLTSAQKQALEFSKLLQSLDLLKTEEKKKQADIAEIEKNIESLHIYFNAWEWKSNQEIEQGIEEIKKEKENFERVEKEWNELRKVTERAGERIKQLRPEMEALNVEIAKAKAVAESVDAILKDSSDDWFKRYLDVEEAVIKTDIQKVRSFIENTQRKYNELSKGIAELETSTATTHKTIEEKARELEALQPQRSQVVEQLAAKLAALSLSEEDARAMDALQMETDKEKNEIDAFYSSIDNLEKRIAEIQKDPDFKALDANLYDSLKLDSKTKEDELQAANVQLGQLRQELTDMEERWGRKVKFEERLAQLQKRIDRLKVLEGLFKGGKFVRYISNFYLKELCASANKRFHQLTRNRLSLVVDDENNFYVIDYLNDGKQRLLKTLSGGQTFQASLCLALALSERVKSVSRSERSFFFLDEGFGALDRDSLAIVMETIKSLRKENRIVGFISHVEEMKEEMDVYLDVKLDKEKGSVVTLQL